MATEGLITLLEPALEEARELVSKALVVRRTEHRPWFEFIRKFNLPKRKRIILEKRTLTNLLYYRVNYIELYLTLLISGTILCGWPSGLIALHILSSLFFFLLFRVAELNVRDNAFRRIAAIFAMSVVALSSYHLLLSLTQHIFFTGFVTGAHVLLRPRSLRSKFNQYGSKGIEAKFYSAEEGRGDEMEYEYESKQEESVDRPDSSEGVFIEASGQYQEQKSEPLSIDQQRGINYLKRREQARRARVKSRVARSRLETMHKDTTTTAPIPTNAAEEKENDENTVSFPQSPQAKQSFQLLQGEPKKITVHKPSVSALTRNNKND